MKKLIVTAVLVCSTASMMHSGNCCTSGFDAVNDEKVCAKATASLLLLREKALAHDADSCADLGHFWGKFADHRCTIPDFSAVRLQTLGLLDSDNKVPEAIRVAFFQYSQYGS